jgi:ribosome maturation factor RimP
MFVVWRRTSAEKTPPNMARRIDEGRIHTIVEPVCRAHGVELVQLVLGSEHGRALLRIVIDRPGSERGPGQGVTIADCQSVSRDLGPALDAHDVALGSYRLEVSSPGLDRPLVKLSDFERFAGREVKVQLRTPIPDGRGGERKIVRGVLLGVDGETVRIEAEGSALQLPHAEILKANVVHKFD